MMYIVYPFSLSQAIARLGPFFILFLFDILDEVFFFFWHGMFVFFFCKECRGELKRPTRAHHTRFFFFSMIENDHQLGGEFGPVFF